MRTERKSASRTSKVGRIGPYRLAFVTADLDAPRLCDVPPRLARKLATHPALLRP